jgi:hypothetical protein
MAEFGCARGELDRIMERIANIPDTADRRQAAIQEALPVRLKMTKVLGELYEHLLGTLHNATELGTIANVELQSLLRCQMLTGHDETITRLTGASLPAEAHPARITWENPCWSTWSSEPPRHRTRTWS